ncbi:MAG: hypothetical protein HQ500_13300 [Flavobacteriales bacterium]|nr:hypothetical protein [Flavobacteriales bacterium]
MRKQQLFLKAVTCLGMVLLSTSVMSQGIPQVKYKLNEDGSNYVRFTGLNQVWLRHTELNQGSTLFGDPVENITDIGIRRLRFQVIAQLTDRVFFYAQFGHNNFSFLQPRYTGSFFHDAITELKLHEQHLSLGAGLTGWSGLSRYASPSIGSMLTLDAPLYQQATNGQNDQFLRKLSLYAKGQVGILDYRLAVTKPMAVQNATGGAPLLNPEMITFNTQPANFQYQGYFKFQLLDQESNLTPYSTGTYLGQKKVLAIGLGFIQQSDAMWKTDALGDTNRADMRLMGADVFFDVPLNAESGMAYTFYGAYTFYDFGPGYVRNVGVMNMANGTNGKGTFNGSGNAFPMIGTGNSLYLQTGVAFGKNVITEGGKLQPYAAVQYSVFRGLDAAMLMAEGGMNWYLDGTTGSKVSVNYQSRPIFDANGEGQFVEIARRGMIQLQYQISF